MAKNYFNRYVWLVDLINRYGYIPMEEINRMWRRSRLNETGGDIPERTFFNHLKAIKETFDITIRCDRSLGYYIVDRNELKTDSLKLWMLQSLSINNIINDSVDLMDRIIFEDSKSCQKWLTIFVKAMKDSKKVKITYQSFSSDKVEEVEIAPYCLKQYKQRWYVLADRGNRDNLKIYALDRIKETVQTNALFIFPADFDSKEYFEHYLGVTMMPDSKLETIDVKVSSWQANYFRSLEIHETQEEIEKTPDYSIFRFHLIPNVEFIKEILSNGAEVEVLEPEWLRKRLQKEISNMAELYNQDQSRCKNAD